LGPPILFNPFPAPALRAVPHEKGPSSVGDEHEPEEKEEKSPREMAEDVRAKHMRLSRACMLRAQHIGDAMLKVPMLVQEHLQRALGLGLFDSDFGIDTITPGIYLPKRGRIRTELADPTGIIKGKGSSITLCKIGKYEINYRVPMVFLDPNVLEVDDGIVNPELFPISFAFIAMGLVAFSGECNRKAHLIPHTLSIVLPTAVGAAVTVPDPPGPGVADFSLINLGAGNLFQYPSTLVQYRNCDCNTRIAFFRVCV
jgi:hypothetical protein